jgi:spore germination protein YaaH
VVNIGPTFSEFETQVTFTQSNGEWNVASEDQIPPPGDGQQTTYTVQPGDTLFAIATEFGTTVDAIVDVNAIVNPSLIFVGQELVIPA